MSPVTRRLLTVIVLVGAALRFVPIWFGLPYPQARPDEETAIGHALDVLKGDLNPHFFHWPSLTFYLFAGVLGAASGLRDVFGSGAAMTFSDHALLARGTVALCGTMTIVVLFRLGQRIAGDAVGLLAATFLAVAILHVRESHFAMTDVLMTLLLWTSLTLLVSAALADRGGTQSSREDAIVCACAGLAGGLAASTKYSAAAVVVAMVVTQLVLVARRRSLLLSWRTWAPLVALAAASVAGFLVGTPYAVLDYPKFVEDLSFEFTHLSGGHNGVSLGRGWIYHATHSLPYGAGIATCAAALAGAVPFARRHGRAACVLGTFAVSFYLAIGSGYTVFFRYVLPLVPFVCLLAAVGVDAAAKWLARRTPVAEGRLLTLLAVLVAGPGLMHSMTLGVVLARTDTRVLAGEWLTARVQPGATLYDAGSAYTQLDLWRVDVVRLAYDSDRNAFVDGPLPEWLVLHTSPLIAYASTSPALAHLARERYVLVHAVQGTREDGASGLYDQQDAFFVPLSGFEHIVRPGPSITIHRRADLPPLTRHP